MGRKKFRQSKTNGLGLMLSLNREHSSERLLHFEEVYRALDVHDQQVIEGCVQALASNERLKNMGVKAAFELVGSLGEWMAFHPLPETEVKDGL